MFQFIIAYIIGRFLTYEYEFKSKFTIEYLVLLLQSSRQHFNECNDDYN